MGMISFLQPKRVEAMKPENIAKEEAEVVVEPQVIEPIVEEPVVEEVKEETKESTTRRRRKND